MRNLANFLLFQAGWCGCVFAAAQGRIWLALLATLAVVAVHLRFVVRPPQRRRELTYLLVVGLVGMLADSGLGLLGATRYPTSEEAWAAALVPPWIVGLWVLFATLPHHSLGWLRGRGWLAALLGAAGGPLSYLAGSRTGAVAVADEPLLTFGALAVEYALVTPFLLHFASRPSA